MLRRRVRLRRRRRPELRAFLSPGPLTRSRGRPVLCARPWHHRPPPGRPPPRVAVGRRLVGRPGLSAVRCSPLRPPHRSTTRRWPRRERWATWSVPTPSPRWSWPPTPPRPPSRSRSPGTPALGNFAIATSPDGRWAYVVTSDGVSSLVGLGRAATTGRPRPPPAGHQRRPPPSGVERAERGDPHRPGHPAGRSPRSRSPGRAAPTPSWCMPGGRTVLAASGSTIVPVDAATRQVGTPLDLGAGTHHLRDGPRPQEHHALRPGGRGSVPGRHRQRHRRRAIPTGLSVSSVYSPHGIVVTADGATVYVVGQGGTDFGGRVLPIVAATGATSAMTGFDQFGISDPAAVAIDPDRIRSCWWPTPPTTGSTRCPWPTSPIRPTRSGCPSGAGALDPGHRSPDRHRLRARAAPGPSWWTDSVPSSRTSRAPRPSGRPSRCARGPRR